MKIVIDIDDNLYTRLFDKGDEYVADMRRACVAIRKGTPLPKGHGKIGDLDKLKQKIETGDDDIMKEDWYKLYDNVISEIDNAYAIIEADKK